MDLSTSYHGLKLPHPLMPGASPLVDDLDTVRKVEDAGAAAITMHSIFEEQITREQVATFVPPSRTASPLPNAQARDAGTDTWRTRERR